MAEQTFTPVRLNLRALAEAARQVLVALAQTSVDALGASQDLTNDGCLLRAAGRSHDGQAMYELFYEHDPEYFLKVFRKPSGEEALIERICDAPLPLDVVVREARSLLRDDMTIPALLEWCKDRIDLACETAEYALARQEDVETNAVACGVTVDSRLNAIRELAPSEIYLMLSADQEQRNSRTGQSFYRDRENVRKRMDRSAQKSLA